MPRHYTFRLQISQQDFLRYYQGEAVAVQVVAECGRRLRFPASRLRPLLSTHGIRGRFRLTVDDRNRFLSIQKLSQ